MVFCCGKLYYELLKQRETTKGKGPALIRLEQLYPFPEEMLTHIVKSYNTAKEWCWVQEEPANMGAWQFVRHRLESLIEKPLTYIGRPPGASPATGFPAIYRQMQTQIVIDAIK